MFCPVCKSEFREGFEECVSCQVNLVKDLTNIEEKVTDEIKVCTNCVADYNEEQKHCEKCGNPLLRAVIRDERYHFLQSAGVETLSLSKVETYMTELEHHINIPEEEAVVLIESEDLQLLAKVQQKLNDNGIHFQYRPPAEDPASLGEVFGSNTRIDPGKRSFPRVLVGKDEEEKALGLVANDPELALFEMPEELMEVEEEEEEAEY